MVPLIDSGSGIAVLAESLEIDATPEASARARRWLDGIPQLRSLGQVAFDVRLLVTELVSNSVRHAGLGSDDRIVVRLTRRQIHPQRHLRVVLALAEIAAAPRRETHRCTRARRE